MFPTWESCDISQGWERRIAAKSGAAGVVGAAAGSIAAVLRQAPLLRFSLGTGASCAFCLGCFGGLQETARRLRCKDDPWNSAIGGAATAFCLVGIQQNNRLKAANAGLYAAAAAAAVHAADNRWHMSMWLRPVTQEELIAAAAANERQRLHEQEVPRVQAWWEAYMPVRKMSDWEWEDYQQRKAESFKARVKAATSGGLPVVVENQRQQRNVADSQPGAPGHVEEQ